MDHRVLKNDGGRQVENISDRCGERDWARQLD